MPVESATFRTNYRRCQWIFDLFAYIFDSLDGRFFPPDQGATYDALDREEKEVHRLKLVEVIRNQDGLIPDEVRRYLDLPDNDRDLESTACYLRLFCILGAIDASAADVNYLAAFVGALPGRWTNVRELIDKKRSLQKDAPGHILLRPHSFEKSGRDWFLRTKSNGKWGVLPTRGVDLQDYFQNLLRVQEPGGCQIELHILPAVQDVALPSGALQIAIVPLIQSLSLIGDEGHLLPGPLRLVKEPGPTSKFGIRLAPAPDPSHACDELCTRAEAALRHLAEWGAHIVLFPEMVVPDPVLARLKEVLYELADHRKPRPQLVLAGSFTRDPASSSPPYNEAVILNGDGLELWRQRKLQPYAMKEHEQKNFDLHPLLNSESCMEDITYQPRVLELRDSKLNRLRMVTLICEDATRPPALTVAGSHEANLILVPVMAGPLNDGCGFTTNLDPLQNEYDALYVIANSAGLARNAWKNSKSAGHPPLGAIGLPLAKADTHKPHVLLTEISPVPGIADLEVLCYQLPES